MTDRHYLFLTCDAGRTLALSLKSGWGCVIICVCTPHFLAALSACVWSLPILSLALAGWRVPHCLCRPPTPLLPLVPVSRSKAANQGWPAPGAGAGVCCIIDGWLIELCSDTSVTHSNHPARARGAMTGLSPCLQPLSRPALLRIESQHLENNLKRGERETRQQTAAGARMLWSGSQSREREREMQGRVSPAALSPVLMFGWWWSLMARARPLTSPGALLRPGPSVTSLFAE